MLVCRLFTHDAPHLQRGVTTVEYAVMLALVVLAVAFTTGIEEAVTDVYQRLISILTP